MRPEQAQLRAELERYRAEVDAGIEHQIRAPIETSLSDVDQDF